MSLHVYELVNDTVHFSLILDYSYFIFCVSFSCLKHEFYKNLCFLLVRPQDKQDRVSWCTVGRSPRKTSWLTRAVGDEVAGSLFSLDQPQSQCQSGAGILLDMPYLEWDLGVWLVTLRVFLLLSIFVGGGTALPELTFSLSLPSFVYSAVTMQPLARPANMLPHFPETLFSPWGQKDCFPTETSS